MCAWLLVQPQSAATRSLRPYPGLGLEFPIKDASKLEGCNWIFLLQFSPSSQDWRGWIPGSRGLSTFQEFHLVKNEECRSLDIVSCDVHIHAAFLGAFSFHIREETCVLLGV